MLWKKKESTAKFTMKFLLIGQRADIVTNTREKEKKYWELQSLRIWMIFIKENKKWKRKGTNKWKKTVSQIVE